MHIAILGRQPEFSIAELCSLYGRENVSLVQPNTALIQTDSFDFNRLGGSQKAGRVIMTIPQTDWKIVSKKVIQHYEQLWRSVNHKITLGISAYGYSHIDAHNVQAIGIGLKKALKRYDVNLRLIPNRTAELNTATSHHNKLGLRENKVEVLIIHDKSTGTIVAESVGAQNITALAARDQARPKTDAFVGMLPPKLARMMIHFAGPAVGSTILDPFCGTGVVLQEALLLGYKAYGSDLSEKMVRYSRENLKWLTGRYSEIDDWHVEQADATNHTWSGVVDAIVCETYLGQPFSAPPSDAKLREVSATCRRIITQFLANISRQIDSGTPLVIAIPAWRRADGTFYRLSIDVEKCGLNIRDNCVNGPLLYYRDNQIVARDILLLEKP